MQLSNPGRTPCRRLRLHESSPVPAPPGRDSTCQPDRRRPPGHSPVTLVAICLSGCGRRAIRQSESGRAVGRLGDRYQHQPTAGQRLGRQRRRYPANTSNQPSAVDCATAFPNCPPGAEMRRITCLTQTGDTTIEVDGSLDAVAAYDLQRCLDSALDRACAVSGSRRHPRDHAGRRRRPWSQTTLRGPAVAARVVLTITGCVAPPHCNRSRSSRRGTSAKASSFAQQNLRRRVGKTVPVGRVELSPHTNRPCAHAAAHCPTNSHFLGGARRQP